MTRAFGLQQHSGPYRWSGGRKHVSHVPMRSVVDSPSFVLRER